MKDMISSAVKVHEDSLRFVSEDTPSYGYEALYDAFLREGVDAEELPDGTRVGRAIITVEADDDERLYIDGDVTVNSVTVADGL